jgi:putative ABC transport system permease protein
LISGISILIGIIIGEVDGRIFTPMINISSSLGGQVLPFKVMSSKGDYINFFIICGSMLVLGLLILIRYVSKIKIDQAIKLGED